MTLHERLSAVPIRHRLVLIVVVVLGLGLTVAGATTGTLLRAYLLEQTDDQIATAARNVNIDTLQQLIADPDSNSVMPSDYFLSLRSPGTTPREIVAEWTLPRFGRPDLPAAVTNLGEAYTVGSDLTGQRWRAVTYGVQDAPTGTTLTVALPLEGADETAYQVARTIVVSGVLIILLGAALSWFAVERALRPLRQIEQTAGAIAAGDLSRRVPANNPRTEVGRLAHSLNTMLAQIEQAFAAQAASEGRMRRFVSDASHELRTPLATVRGYGELYRMGAIPEAELPAAMARIEGEARRMGGLVTDLLQLARLDEGRRLAREPVDLAVLAHDAVADLRALDPERTATFLPLAEGITGPEAMVVVGDENALRQVLSNLTGNVVRHTPSGTPVEVAAGRLGADVVVEVRDHGPGISPEHAERVFERFYRLDDSRARSSGGSGLGLAIVSALVAAHGGTARVLPTPGGGTTVRVTLPAAGSAPA
ncbi:sensor histidine kinase [Georgenia satyanarayanai]|uniref:sensor histidine kinase n=1 Tax=Georgenia satyanarayanai TaxID=860221 RepID=UPI00126403E8|nr:HAMP domain-containing sensor histidine kinase [Georgenia satyanarayanai]